MVNRYYIYEYSFKNNLFYTYFTAVTQNPKELKLICTKLISCTSTHAHSHKTASTSLPYFYKYYNTKKVIIYWCEKIWFAAKYTVKCTYDDCNVTESFQKVCNVLGNFRNISQETFILEIESHNNHWKPGLNLELERENKVQWVFQWLFLLLCVRKRSFLWTIQ